MLYVKRTHNLSLKRCISVGEQFNISSYICAFIKLASSDSQRCVQLKDRN